MFDETHTTYFYRNGINRFLVEPGKADLVLCQSCGAVCHVERGVSFDRSQYIRAPQGTFDVFKCPKVNQPWHQEADHYAEEIRKTRSKRLRQLIFLDLTEYLAEQGVSHYPTLT